MDETGEVVYLSHNILGHLSWMATSKGIFKHEEEISAYGPQGHAKPIQPDLLSYAKSLSWQSQTVDPTGLIWMGARYYDPVLGRFISQDPVSYPNCLDPYAYAGGDPINYYDPDGRFESPINKSIGATTASSGRGGAFAQIKRSLFGLMPCGSAFMNAKSEQIGGMVHGAADFALNSVHDALIMNAHLGASEMGFSHFDRSHMTQGMEQVHHNQSIGLENFLQNHLSFDQSSPLYQSTRYMTTTGLGVSSVAAGGYGVVKLGMSVHRLPQISMQISKFVSNESLLVKELSQPKKIWTSTKRNSSVQNAYRHWKDHGHEFPELLNSKQYVEATRDFINNHSSGTLTKIRLNGDVVFYDPVSNTFAVTNQKGLPRTMYKPDPLIHKYETNLEYFYGQ